MTIPMPESYIAAHSAGYTGFRDMVVAAAKEWLMAHGGKHSTIEISDALWPTRAASGYNIEIRKRLVDVLLKCADDPKYLGAYASRGPVSGQAYGKPKRPWVWEAARVSETAPFVASATAVRREASAEEIASVLSVCPGGEYLSIAQKLGMAKHLLDNMWVETEA